MKAPIRDAANILPGVLLSVGALSLSLSSSGRFDLILSEPFGSTMVLSRTASTLAAMIVLHSFVRAWAKLKPQCVRVRR